MNKSLSKNEYIKEYIQDNIHVQTSAFPCF